MFSYTLRQLILFIITLLLLTLVGFSLLRLDPDVPQALQAFFPSWINYISELTQLNFGVNSHGIAIIDELVIAFPATLELCLMAFVLSLLIGIPLGTIAGGRQGKWFDTVISIASLIGYATPLFWLALLLIMTFSLHYEWLPVSGRYDLLYQVKYITGFALIDAFFAEGVYRAHALRSVIEHMILPCFVLAIVPTTQIVRLMRSSVAEIINKNYIRAAKIRGLSRYEIISQHIFRNAIPPILPKFGAQLSNMLTLAIVTESVFNWPGIGRWLLNALANQDYVAIQAGVIVLGTFVLMANVLSELVGAMINPLVRKEWYAKK